MKNTIAIVVIVLALSCAVVAILVYDLWKYLDANRIIALTSQVAALAAVYGVYWSVRKYRKANRPYVWAVNYNESDYHHPEIVGFSVANRPAFIKRIDINFSHERIESVSITNRVFYPLPTGEAYWKERIHDVRRHTYQTDKEVWYGTKRSIYIRYNGLNDSTEYTYESHAILSVDDPITAFLDDKRPPIWVFESELVT